MDYIVSQQKILHKRPNPKVYRPLRAEKTTALPKIGSDDIEYRKLINYYFRYKICSLINFIIRKDTILSIRSESTQTLLSKLTKLELKGNVREDILSRLIRVLSTRSKFKYREKFDLQRASILKQINYNFKSRNHSENKNIKSINPAIKEEETYSEDEKNDRKDIPQKSNRGESTPSRFGELKRPKEKIFIVVGGYDDLKHSLISRGWIENKDPNSHNFQFKWTLKIKDIDYGRLIEGQIVNHFEKNGCLTSKVGICRNLRNLIWSDKLDISNFYPRCYDLEDSNEFEDFLEDFKFTKAEAIIKEFFDRNHGRTDIKIDKNIELILCISLAVLERKNLDIYDKIRCITNCVLPLTSKEEWQILENEKINLYDKNPTNYDKLLEKYDVLLEFKGKNKPKAELLLEKTADLLNVLEKDDPQFCLNGKKNIWIVKPALLSRGRGIRCFNTVSQILDYIISKKIPYVCQKYIENPLIIHQKKFDIRQWVLVTDLSPLTIWFYDECYIRFSADEYDPQNLSNKFSHLTNNSIAKHSSKFEKSEIEGNMWTMSDFSSYLNKETQQKNFFYEVIQPQMKQIVINILKSVEDMITYRKKSVELYGFDFMIDDNLKPWIIEINSSPAMDYSTKVTEKLVKNVMEDVVKVIIDYPLRKNFKNVDTGHFKCIFSGSEKPSYS